MTPAMVRLAVILGLLSMLGPFSIDMYLPAMPQISTELMRSEAAVQGTITSYFIAYGLAQMIYGPWADQSGRRIPILAGGAIFIVGAAGPAMSTTLDSLMVWRAIQGLGGASLMIVPRAVVRDRYTGIEATRLMALILLVISVSPMLAPLAGTLVMAFTGWRAIFWVLCVIAVLSLSVTWFALPETLAPQNRVAVKPRTILRNCGLLLRDRTFLGLTFIGAFGMGSFFVYLASAPFVYAQQFGLSPTQFSLAFAANAVGFFGASQTAGPLAARLGLRPTILLGLSVFTVAGLAFFLVAASGGLSLWWMIALLLIGNAGLGLVIPTTMVLALDPFGEMAGLASSLGGTIQLIFGGILIALSGLFFDGTALPMAAAVMTCGICALALGLGTLKKPPQSA